jgi:hypothetical protein
MSNFPNVVTNIDWLYVGELYALIFASILTVTLALMLAASLMFWALYPKGSIAGEG